MTHSLQRFCIFLLGLGLIGCTPAAPPPPTATPAPTLSPTASPFPTIAPGQFDSAVFEGDLLAAIKLDDLETAQRLLLTVPEQKALLTEGCTRAFTVAAARGQVEIVRFFLKNGMDADAPGELNYTALEFAAMSNRIEVVRLLLESGAEPNLASNKTFALVEAAKNGHAEVVSMLLDAGANVNQIDERDKDTALLWAVDKGHNEVVRILLEHKADFTIRNKYGSSAYSWALNIKNDEAVKLLEAAGAKE